MNRLHRLLGEFATRNGIDALHPDDEGRFHIVVDDAVRVECFERFGRLHLVSRLGPGPEPGEAARAWVRSVLNHALKRMKHCRGTLALQANGDAILFARVEVGGLSADGLEARIEEHVDAVEKYRRRLAAPAPSTSPGGIPRSIVRP